MNSCVGCKGDYRTDGPSARTIQRAVSMEMSDTNHCSQLIHMATMTSTTQWEKMHHKDPNGLYIALGHLESDLVSQGINRLHMSYMGAIYRDYSTPILVDYDTITSTPRNKNNIDQNINKPKIIH